MTNVDEIEKYNALKIVSRTITLQNHSERQI